MPVISPGRHQEMQGYWRIPSAWMTWKEDILLLCHLVLRSRTFDFEGLKGNQVHAVAVYSTDVATCGYNAYAQEFLPTGLKGAHAANSAGISQWVFQAVVALYALSAVTLTSRQPFASVCGSRTVDA